MKSALVLLALVTVACAGKILVEESSADGDVTTYGYLEKYAIPFGEKLREAEEEYLQNNKRIVGGAPADIEKLPYQAGILIDIRGFEGKGVCSGTLFTRSRVLTAAHCWYDGRSQALLFEIVLGSSLLYSGGSRHITSAVAVHPRWSPLRGRNDIAIVYLPSHVDFSDTISPVSLPEGSEVFESFAGETAIASGFGLTADNAVITFGQFLSHVSVKVMSNSDCKWAFPFVIKNTNICTSGIPGGPCSGDSGGPLVVHRGGKAILIGATSFGSAKGCQALLPTVYTRVTQYLDWIKQHSCDIGC